MFRVGMSATSRVRKSIINQLVQLLCKFIRILLKMISSYVKSFSSYLICCASWTGFAFQMLKKHLNPMCAIASIFNWDYQHSLNH